LHGIFVFEGDGSGKLWAQLLGLYVVAIAVGMLVNRRRTMATIDEMARSGPWDAVFGHGGDPLSGWRSCWATHVWSGGALPVLVSLMGWAALLKGLTLLLVPGERVATAYKGAGFERWFGVWMAAALAFGLWMAWLAFTA
jgi:hypothetical protein